MRCDAEACAVLVCRLASYVLCGSPAFSDLSALYLLTMTHDPCMYWIGGNAGVYLGAAAGANGKCLYAQPQGGGGGAHPPPPPPPPGENGRAKIQKIGEARTASRRQP
jgi:hypothetical protein